MYMQCNIVHDAIHIIIIISKDTFMVCNQKFKYLVQAYKIVLIVHLERVSDLVWYPLK